MGLPDTALELLEFLLGSFLLLSPMLLLGLLLAGLIHVTISKSAVLRWLSDDSLKSVCTSAAVGVPIPLCSCSVVPVVAEMRNKGASRSSCMSFLITAPETGADSILVTHAFFGFVAALVRPVVSFVTAVVTGVLCIGLIRDQTGRQASEGNAEHCHSGAEDTHRRDHEGHGHDHGGHSPLMTASEDCYVSPAQFREMLRTWARRLHQTVVPGVGGARSTRARPAYDAEAGDEPTPNDAARNATTVDQQELPGLGKVVRHIFRYGFVEVADEILFALVVGILLGGVLFLAVPDGLMSSDYARWISYPVMVLVGVPLYICASASTPIAAALVAKGLSPGAALIFLMTGPATNSGTIAIIVGQFGARFASIYVMGVIVTTTAIGIAIDMLMIALGLQLPVSLSASGSPAVQVVEWTAAFALLALIVWRFRAGAMRSGYRDLVSNLTPVLGRSRRA